MIDKHVASSLKELKSFLEFWEKFHSIYESTLSKTVLSADDEAKFLETRNLIREKYEALKSILDFKYTPHTRLTDPVQEVLDVENIRFVSERMNRKTEDDWRDSYVFLNSILERLYDNRQRARAANPAGAFLKKIFARRET
jgi:hypothetical protein